MHAVVSGLAPTDALVGLLANAGTADTNNLSSSSTSKKIATAVKNLFKTIPYYTQLTATMVPILSTFMYLPLAAYHGLYTVRESGDEKRGQIQNALACCILAVPLLGQFYFLKATTEHTIEYSINQPGLEIGKIRGKVVSTDPLFSLIVTYWFAESDLHESLPIVASPIKT